MPMEGIEQPEFIAVEPGIRLRRYDGCHDFAIAWYQDPDTVELVDGVRTPYTKERLDAMYRFLNQAGELYWIEVEEDGTFVPVGDVTLWHKDLPIVIGRRDLRGQGLGYKVVCALVQRGRDLGWKRMEVGEIYAFNTASRRCFEKAGFVPVRQTDAGAGYALILEE